MLISPYYIDSRGKNTSDVWSLKPTEQLKLELVNNNHGNTKATPLTTRRQDEIFGNQKLPSRNMEHPI